MKVEKRVHNGYTEMLKANKEHKGKFPFLRQLFGRYQYICSSKKGWISCAAITNMYQKLEWEIYCLEGNLFEDVIKCKSSKDALKKAEEFLG